MKNKKIIFIITALCCMMIMSACGATSYSAKEYYEPYVVGAEGNGVFKMSVNEDLKEQILNEALPKDATELEEFQYELLLEGMEYEAEPKDNLSNGDIVKIKVKCDEKALSSIKIKFTNTEFTYTVEGLEEVKELDVWSDVNVTYDGIAPNGKIQIEYSGNDDFVKNNVRYSPDKTSGLSNGDEITVKISVSSKSLMDNLCYIPTSDLERKFTVEGLDAYLREDVDLSDIDEKMYAFAEDLNKNSENYQIGAETQAKGFFASGSLSGKYKIIDSNITPFKRVLLSGQYGNEYAVFYKMNYMVESLSGNENAGHESGWTGESDDLYLCIYIEDIMKLADGTLEYDSEKLNYNWYGYSFMRSFVGADFEEVYNKYYYDNSRYNLEQIIYDDF